MTNHLSPSAKVLATDDDGVSFDRSCRVLFREDALDAEMRATDDPTATDGPLPWATSSHREEAAVEAIGLGRDDLAEHIASSPHLVDDVVTTVAVEFVEPSPLFDRGDLPDGLSYEIGMLDSGPPGGGCREPFLGAADRLSAARAVRDHPALSEEATERILQRIRRSGHLGGSEVRDWAEMLSDDG